MSVSFEYRLTGAGWSECTLAVGDKHVVLTASYLSDALRSLLSAVCRVLEGGQTATATFDEEPGEYRWRLFRLDEDRLRILILAFDELWSGKPDEAGNVIYEVECRLKSFAGAVYSECQALLAKLGPEGYKDEWCDHEFPIEEFEKLGELLCSKR